MGEASFPWLLWLLGLPPIWLFVKFEVLVLLLDKGFAFCDQLEPWLLDVPCCKVCLCKELLDGGIVVLPLVCTFPKPGWLDVLHCILLLCELLLGFTLVLLEVCAFPVPGCMPPFCFGLTGARFWCPTFEFWTLFSHSMASSSCSSMSSSSQSSWTSMTAGSRFTYKHVKRISDLAWHHTLVLK